MKNISISCLMFLLILPQFLCAQSEMLPGWVITAQGDTLAGKVGYKGTKTKVSSVVYQSIFGNEQREFSPTEARAFGFAGGDRFYSLRLPTEANPQVFAWALIKARASAYQYGDQFFAEGDNMTLFLLNITSRIEKIQGLHRQVYSTQHLGLLKVMFQDCEIDEKYYDAIKISLKAQPISKLFDQYNRCADPDYNPEVGNSRAPWMQVEVGILGGFVSSQVRFNATIATTSYRYIHEADYGKANTPYFGVSSNFSSPRISKKFSFQLELTGYGREYNGYDEAEVSPNYIEKHNVKIKYSALDLAFGIRYTFARENARWQPYVQGGGAVAFLINAQFVRDRERRITNTEGIETVLQDVTNLPYMADAQYFPWLGLGVRRVINDRILLQIEVRGEEESNLIDPSGANIVRDTGQLPKTKSPTFGGQVGLVYRLH